MLSLVQWAPHAQVHREQPAHARCSFGFPAVCSRSSPVAIAMSSSVCSWRSGEEAGPTPDYPRVHVHLEGVLNSKTPVTGRGDLRYLAGC